MSTDIGSMLAQLDRRLAAVEHASRLSSASIDDTSIEVRDGNGGLRALVGQQADGTTAANFVNGAAPPAPSAPTAASALGGIGIAWDGQFADGAILPLDWQRVEVHASPVPGFTPIPATLQATIETPQGGGVYIPATGNMYVRLLSRNTSGTPSAATVQVGPYAPRPVEGDIAPGGITETLIAPGAITTPLLAAGAVDAVALHADAITGKTITGGVINGSVMRTATSGARVAINESGNDAIELFDSADRLVGVLDGAGLRLIGDNGSEVGIDPDDTYPNLYLTSDDGTQRAVINVFGGTASDAGIGLNSGKFTSGAITDWKWRTLFGRDGWAAERIRDSDQTYTIGGRVVLSPTVGQLAYSNSADTTQNSTFTMSPNLAQVTTARLEVTPAASALSMLFGNAASGHTGNMLRLQKNLVDMAVVDNNGNLNLAGHVTAGDSDVVNYTPTVGNGGTATFSTRAGWSVKFGKLVYWHAQLVVSAAGSGTSTVTITSPSAPDRTLRQICTMSAEGVKASGLFATGYLMSITTGSGTVWDRMTTQDNSGFNRLNLVQGAHLLSGSQIVIQGFYLEA